MNVGERHISMQCPAEIYIREDLSRQIDKVCPQIDQQEYFNVVMGKYILGWEFDDMLPICKITCKQITKMYRRATSKTEGVG